MQTYIKSNNGDSRIVLSEKAKDVYFIASLRGNSKSARISALQNTCMEADKSNVSLIVYTQVVSNIKSFGFENKFGTYIRRAQDYDKRKDIPAFKELLIRDQHDNYVTVKYSGKANSVAVLNQYGERLNIYELDDATDEVLALPTLEV